MVRVSAIFRDFSDDQPNFGGNTCTALRDGAVANRLDQDGKPTLSADTAKIAAACRCAQEIREFMPDPAVGN